MQSNFPAPNSPYSMEAFWQKYAGNNRPQDDSTTTPTILSSGIFIDGNTLQSAMSSSNGMICFFCFFVFIFLK